MLDGASAGDRVRGLKACPTLRCPTWHSRQHVYCGRCGANIFHAEHEGAFRRWALAAPACFVLGAIAGGLAVLVGLLATLFSLAMCIRESRWLGEHPERPYRPRGRRRVGARWVAVQEPGG